MHVIGHDCPTGAVCVSTWSSAKVHVLLSSLIRAFFFFFLLITLAIRNAILEMYWRVITHMNSMNISWQIYLAPFSEVAGFWPKACHSGRDNTSTHTSFLKSMLSLTPKLLQFFLRTLLWHKNSKNAPPNRSISAVVFRPLGPIFGTTFSLLSLLGNGKPVVQVSCLTGYLYMLRFLLHPNNSLLLDLVPGAVLTRVFEQDLNCGFTNNSLLLVFSLYPAGGMTWSLGAASLGTSVILCTVRSRCYW